MHLSKPALFLSVLLAASPNTSLFTQALPADIKPVFSRRSSSSQCSLLLFGLAQCIAVAELPPLQIILTEDKCASFTDSTSTVQKIGYLSGLTSADGLLIAGANCTVNVYTGLLCQGYSIGKIPVVNSPKQGECVQFNPLPPLPIGRDPSNPLSLPGANSAKLTCH